MIVRYVEIRNFRGIRKLDWSVPGSMVCLIGPGDTTKSTILTAIEYALSPRWNLQILDTDFYACDTKQPLQITITVGQLPDELLKDEKFGCFLRGWNTSTGIRDEPEDEDELVLSIQFAVDEALEPSWKVITDRQPEGKNISGSDRAKLGVNRLGSYVDREFAWGRGAALTRFTSEVTGTPESVSGVIADANRQAREAVVRVRGSLSSLQAAAQEASTSATQFGVRSKKPYQPALDALTGGVGAGSLALHEGDIPVRLAGQGSRRLLALALQRKGVSGGAILLVDEVEQALEPHRLRHLLRLLRPQRQIEGQTFLTTHSPVSIQELRADELFEVRSSGGETTIHPVKDVEALQGILRRAPDAFLAGKVIVCEGKTEFGICRALDLLWAEETGFPFAYLSVVPVDGGGSQAPKTALRLAKFGCDTVLVVDSDDPKVQPEIEECEKAGATILQWDGGCSIEERVCFDLPTWKALRELIGLALEHLSKETVIAMIANELKVSTKMIDLDAEWLGVRDKSEREVRVAIGKAAKRSGDNAWFKRIDYGERLGELIYKYLPDIPETDLAKKLQLLKNWVGYDIR